MGVLVPRSCLTRYWPKMNHLALHQIINTAIFLLILCVRQPISSSVMTKLLTARTTNITRSLKNLLGGWKLPTQFSSTEHRATEDVFRRIWADNYWGNAESRSGGGSSLTQTADLRVSLAAMLQELKITSMLDLPCGDFHWMKEVAFCPEMSYVGGDIVDELIINNRLSYASDRFQFETLNLKTSDLPQVDLVFCRDCLVHLDINAIQDALCNIKRSKSKLILMTHFTNRRPNQNIETGQWRPINWTQSPYNFPQPLQLIDERCSENDGAFRDKSMALWNVSEIPT